MILSPENPIIQGKKTLKTLYVETGREIRGEEEEERPARRSKMTPMRVLSLSTSRIEEENL